MDSTPNEPAVGHDLATEAEGLLRCLAGVSHVRVVGGAAGIDAIHIVAVDNAIAPAMAGHVRSALLAGLATPVLPARIHVRVLEQASSGGDLLDDDALGHRFRLLDAIQGGDADGREGQSGPENGVEPVQPAYTDDRADGESPEPHAASLPRLVSVELDRRDDGRTRCRVAIAFRTRVYHDDAIAVDIPGATAHAAAQAVVRALGRAGVDGLELDGVRQVEIASHDHAVVALRRVDTSTRVRSGSALVARSVEHAAALAAVNAARELL